jgi:GntR family transcriptional regulator
LIKDLEKPLTAESLTQSPVPLYHQLKEHILERIEGGEWPPGFRVPSESELSSQFSISRATVRQAIQVLANQGLVEKRQGSGTFVSRPKLAHNLKWMLHDANEVQKRGGELRYELHYLLLKEPPLYIATRLGISAGERAYEVCRTLIADGEQLMLITIWLPERLFPDLPARDMGPRSMMHILKDYGHVITHQHKELEIAVLDEHEAGLLKVDAGAPSLLMTYVNYLQDWTPLEFRRTYVRGDRCKYYVDQDRPEPMF